MVEKVKEYLRGTITSNQLQSLGVTDRVYAMCVCFNCMNDRGEWGQVIGDRL